MGGKIMWLEEEEIIAWILERCHKNDGQIEQILLDIVKSRKGIVMNVSREWYKYLYCRYIENDPEVWKRIKSSLASYQYCLYVGRNRLLKNNITSPYIAYLYCKNIRDDPYVRKNITYYHEARRYRDNINWSKGVKLLVDLDKMYEERRQQMKNRSDFPVTAEEENELMDR